MNSEPNTSQDHVSNINIRWQELDLKLCTKLSQTHLVLKTIEETSTYFFDQLYMYGNITKTVKNTSRTCYNFPGILQEILACIGVQITRIKGVCSKKKIKKTQRSSGPKVTKPKPTDLMDPDQANAPGALD